MYASLLSLCQGERCPYHLKKRNHDQAEQNHQCDQDDHIEGIRDNVQKLILQTGRIKVSFCLAVTQNISLLSHPQAFSLSKIKTNLGLIISNSLFQSIILAK